MSREVTQSSFMFQYDVDFPTSAFFPSFPTFLGDIIFISVTKPDSIRVNLETHKWPRSLQLNGVPLKCLSCESLSPSDSQQGLFSYFELPYSNLVHNVSFNDSKGQVQINSWEQSQKA